MKTLVIHMCAYYTKTSHSYRDGRPHMWTSWTHGITIQKLWDSNALHYHPVIPWTSNTVFRLWNQIVVAQTPTAHNSTGRRVPAAHLTQWFIWTRALKNGVTEQTCLLDFVANEQWFTHSPPSWTWVLYRGCSIGSLTQPIYDRLRCAAAHSGTSRKESLLD